MNIPAVLQIFFYLGFIFLWFKDSFEAFRVIKIHPLFALIPLIAVTVFRLFRRMKNKEIRPAASRDWVFPSFLVLLLVLTRIPLLVHHFGLFTGDDAIPALMAKHIAEGKTPPLFFYGQLYLGSLPSHLIAAAFGVFGYAPLLVKIAAFAFYPAFVLLHYRLLKKLFPETFARAVSLFYCLPLQQAIIISLDNTSHYALVLFLGTLAISLAHDIAHRGRLSLIPALGFFMGISFWTHEISTVFILTACLIVFRTLRLHPEKIAVLGVFGSAGAFPLVLQNIFGPNPFVTLRFLFGGGAGEAAGARFPTSIGLLHRLLGPEPGIVTWSVLLAALAGFLVLIFRSLKSRSVRPEILYLVFAGLFAVIYFLSGFGSIPVIRYLYPLVFCLPVFLFTAVWTIRWKGLRVGIAAAILLTLSYQSLSSARDFLHGVKEKAQTMKSAIEAMKETGQRYWLGEYWTAYALTALSGEDLIVNSCTINRYAPYRLRYENRTGRDNFVFLVEARELEKSLAENLLNILETYGIVFESRTIGATRLIHGIENPVFLTLLDETRPAPVPVLDSPVVEVENGYLNIAFPIFEPRNDFIYQIRAGIPGFSNTVRNFMGTDEEISVRLPYPEGRFAIHREIAFKGLVIPESVKEIPVDLPEADGFPVRTGVVPLSGVSSPRRVFDRTMRIFEKEAVLEIHGISDRSTRVRLHVYSPFDFTHWSWYGSFTQTLSLLINGETAGEFSLSDGDNILEFDFDTPAFRKGRNVITLNFSYHRIFPFANLWKTAALLERVEILPESSPHNPDL